MISKSFLNDVIKAEVSGVLNTLFKVLIIFAVIGCVMTYFSPFWILCIIWGMIILLFFTFIGLYIYFSIKKPDYLRSEKYHLNKQAIEIFGDNDKVLNTNAEYIVHILNPINNKNTLLDEQV